MLRFKREERKCKKKKKTLKKVIILQEQKKVDVVFLHVFNQLKNKAK